MSKLEELIQQYCPDGVEYVKLGDIEDQGYIKLGRGNVISKQDMKDCPGGFPVYSSSSVGDGEIGRYGKYMFDDERISWSIDGGGKFFYRNNLRYSITNVSGWLKVLAPKVVSTKYLYYTLMNEWVKKVYDYTHKAHPSVIREEYIIPIPPLPVQKEIVRVLDTFTELQAELQAELQKRLQQYKYYRDNLLSFEGRTDVEWKKLGEIATE
jgi:type I restriction enzyme S subunit